LPKYFTTNKPFDSTNQLSERELKHLKKAWSEQFSKEIFPLINEDRFSVIYSDNPATRPNHPVNVYIEQPISKNSLTNFRTAVYRYNEEHGVDLIQEEVESHAKAFTKLLNIDCRSIRMDSFSIKKTV